jgi:hypothetical protein
MGVNKKIMRTGSWVFVERMKKQEEDWDTASSCVPTIGVRSVNGSETRGLCSSENPSIIQNIAFNFTFLCNVCSKMS